MSKEKLGKKLRRLREEHKLPLRKVAALLDIDVAILSKMERGERKLNKEVVLKLAEIYHHDPEELVIMYLSEKILYEIGDEELALKGLLAAEGEVRYRARPRELTREEVIEKFRRKKSYELPDDDKKKRFLVYFHIDKVLPLIGDHE